jgi:integrase
MDQLELFATIPAPAAVPPSTLGLTVSPLAADEPVAVEADPAVEGLIADGGTVAPPHLVRPAPLTGIANATLADVMAFVSADPDISAVQRGDRRCALRVLAKVLGKELALIPAEIEPFRPMVAAALPGAYGISEKRWGNIRSRVLASMASAGLPVMTGRSMTTLSPAWDRLLGQLPNKGRLGLSRFMHFCTREGIEPDQVDDAVFDRYRAALQGQSMVKSPHQVHRTACDQWNKSTHLLPGLRLALVRVPANPRHYALSWSDFPASFLVDVEAFLGRGNTCSPFDDGYVRRQRPGTIELQRKQILQMASLLVRSGFPIEEISSLNALADLPTARRILELAHARLGERAPHLHGMANLLKVLARNWCKAPTDTVARLTRYAGSCAPERRGMTAKNSARLRQFDSKPNLQALLDLPRRVFRELGRVKDPDRADCLRAQYGLAVAMLIAAPMRVGNLASLELGRHIVTIGRRKAARQHIIIPGEETKTGEPFEVEIPAETTTLLETYRKLYLPQVSTVPTALLFPNQAGTIRSEVAFSGSLADFIKRETGLVMNAHLFRHFAVTLYLRTHPEDLETARRILGHKSLTTTMRHYALINTKVSFGRYDAVIASYRTRSSTRIQTPGLSRGAR